MTLHIVPMTSGGAVALQHFSCPASKATPVIVTHGTISNGESVTPLANHLVEQGFDCWVLEWGGHGQSDISHTKQDFEYPAFNDVPTAIDFVLEQTGSNEVHWVSHSGGGHLALMYLTQHPEHRHKIASIASLGAQATHGALGIKLKLRALALYGITKLFGHTPKAIVAVGTEGEPSLLLAQWAKWNLSKKWIGNDGTDYLQAFSDLSLPCFIASGTADDIAPVEGCRRVYDALGSENKAWLECGIAHGFSKNYTHGQLVMGRAAKAEIFPKISEWLLTHS